MNKSSYCKTIKNIFFHSISFTIYTFYKIEKKNETLTKIYNKNKNAFQVYLLFMLKNN